MTKMKILCLGMMGDARSKHLAEYLQSKGYETEYGGVQEGAVNPVTQEAIDLADVVIGVSPLVTWWLDWSITGLHFNIDRTYIELCVPSDRPRQEVYSDLEEHIQKYLPL